MLLTCGLGHQAKRGAPVSACCSALSSLWPAHPATALSNAAVPLLLLLLHLQEIRTWCLNNTMPTLSLWCSLFLWIVPQCIWSFLFNLLRSVTMLGPMWFKRFTIIFTCIVRFEYWVTHLSNIGNHSGQSPVEQCEAPSPEHRGANYMLFDWMDKIKTQQVRHSQIWLAIKPHTHCSLL